LNEEVEVCIAKGASCWPANGPVPTGERGFVIVFGANHDGITPAETIIPAE